MKILHTVEQYYPSIGGMQEVVKQISERLAALGHEVTVATSKNTKSRPDIINKVKIKEFEISGNLANGLKGNILNYQNFVLKSDFDIMTNFAAQQWATDALLDILEDIKAKKVFVPTGFSALYNNSYKKYFEGMKQWIKQYDVNIFLSYKYRDIQFAKKNGVKKNKFIPNGAAEEEFLVKTSSDLRKRLGIPSNHFLILHVGSHTGMKGHRETIEIFQQSKIKNSTLLIIGNSFGGGCTTECMYKSKISMLLPSRFLDDKKIIITSLSRNETVEAYLESELFLFPSYIECSPIVLFECMASKTPFLTSDVGNSREILSWSKAGLILPTNKDEKGFSNVKIKESVAILEKIFLDKKTRNKMQINGYNAWKNKFTWEKIAKQYESLYKKISL